MFFFPQAEAEEDCHSDTIRVGDDDENESPAETDLQACFFIVYLILIPSFCIHKQKLVIIVRIYRFLFALNLTVFLYSSMEY